MLTQYGHFLYIQTELMTVNTHVICRNDRKFIIILKFSKMCAYNTIMNVLSGFFCKIHKKTHISKRDNSIIFRLKIVKLYMWVAISTINFFLFFDIFRNMNGSGDSTLLWKILAAILDFFAIGGSKKLGTRFFVLLWP